MEITCLDGIGDHPGKRCRDGTENGERQRHDGSSGRHAHVRSWPDIKRPVMEKMPTFTGGLVGYFSYDYIKYSEPKLKADQRRSRQDFRDMDLMLFDEVIAFDHYQAEDAC